MKIITVILFFFLMPSIYANGLELFDVPLRNAKKEDLSKAIHNLGVKAILSSRDREVFEMSSHDFLGAKQLELVYWNDIFVLAQFKIEKTTQEDVLREKMAKTYGLPTGLKKFVGATEVDGKHYWNFPYEMEISFTKKSGSDYILVTYMDRVRKAELEKLLKAKAGPGQNSPDIPALAKLSVTSSPDEAQVTINGSEVGSTPLYDLEMAPGSTVIVISKAGYVAEHRTVLLKANEIEKVDFVIKKVSLPVLTENRAKEKNEWIDDSSRFDRTPFLGGFSGLIVSSFPQIIKSQYLDPGYTMLGPLLGLRIWKIFELEARASYASDQRKYANGKLSGNKYDFCGFFTVCFYCQETFRAYLSAGRSQSKSDYKFKAIVENLGVKGTIEDERSESIAFQSNNVELGMALFRNVLRLSAGRIMPETKLVRGYALQDSYYGTISLNGNF